MAGDKSGVKEASGINITKIIAFLAILVLFVIASKAITGNVIVPKNSGVISSKNAPLIGGTFLESLQESDIMNDLPKTGEIGIVLYSEKDSGWEKKESYTIYNRKVSKGDAKNPDVIVHMLSKYLEESNDPCQIVKKAKADNGIRLELKRSKVSLMWKYGKMLGYMECFS